MDVSVKHGKCINYIYYYIAVKYIGIYNINLYNTQWCKKLFYQWFKKVSVESPTYIDGELLGTIDYSYVSMHSFTSHRINLQEFLVNYIAYILQKK